jgi:hypothetical protein
VKIERAITIHITATPLSAVQENVGTLPSAPSAAALKSSPANRFAAPPMRAEANDADDWADGSGRGDGTTVRANPLKTNDEFAAGGMNANISHVSAPGKNAAPDSRAR